jgi:hypothetical protein
MNQKSTDDSPDSPMTPLNNAGKTVRHISGIGISILPGETRLVPAHLLPEPISAPPPGEPAPEPISWEAVAAAWLAHSVADIKKLLPVITIKDIDALEEQELAAKKPRQGLLSALKEARLSRAADPEMDAFRATVRTLNRAELLTHAELAAEDPPRRAIIEVALMQLPAESDDGQPGSE